MNDHSKDSQTRYLKETAIVLAREGFQCWRISTALCWLEFRANTESTSSHGIGSMGTQAYRHQQSADRKCSLLCLWPFGPAKNSEPEEAIPRN